MISQWANKSNALSIRRTETICFCKQTSFFLLNFEGILAIRRASLVFILDGYVLCATNAYVTYVTILNIAISLIRKQLKYFLKKLRTAHLAKRCWSPMVNVLHWLT